MEKEKVTAEKNICKKDFTKVAIAFAILIVPVALLAYYHQLNNNVSVQNIPLEVHVSESTYERVVNPDGITNEYDVYYNFGGTCFSQVGATLRNIANDNGQVLVKYTPPSNYEPGSCPKGTLFFINEEKFSNMILQYQKIRDQEEKEKNRVRNLLAKNQ